MWTSPGWRGGVVHSKGGLEDGEGEWSPWRGGVVGSRGGLEDGEGEWSAVSGLTADHSAPLQGEWSAVRVH